MKETERARREEAMRKWKRQNEERVGASRRKRCENRERERKEDKFEIERENNASKLGRENKRIEKQTDNSCIKTDFS